MGDLVDLENAYYGSDGRQQEQSVGGDSSSARTTASFGVVATEGFLPVGVVEKQQLIRLHTVGSVKASPASTVQAAETQNTRGIFWNCAGYYALCKH